MNPIYTSGKSPWDIGHGNSDPVRPESAIMTDAETVSPISSGDNRRKDKQGRRRKRNNQYHKSCKRELASKSQGTKKMKEGEQERRNMKMKTEESGSHRMVGPQRHLRDENLKHSCHCTFHTRRGAQYALQAKESRTSLVRRR